MAATRLALVGSAASAWWQLALANERMALGDQSLMNAQRTFDLVARRYEAGAASAVEMKDAEQSIASQEAQRTRLRQAREEARNALAALLGEHVYDGPEPKALPTTTLPEIPAGLPSDLLVRRPDLAAAQARLRRALAARDAALADSYPRLTLTGSAGGVSGALSDVLRAPSLGLTGGVTFPFLDARRARLSAGVAKVDHELAAEQFRQTFYDALRDTENALSNIAVTLTQGEHLVRDLSAARQAESLYAQQYKAGAIPLRTVLDAQERRRVAQNAVIQNRFDQLNAQMALYMALGGEPPAQP
ncbi:outer membrane protein TolC [Caulobacter segnis]|nr:outer membrane protein TolC [Caulobacter segnis]